MRPGTFSYDPEQLASIAGDPSPTRNDPPDRRRCSLPPAAHTYTTMYAPPNHCLVTSQLAITPTICRLHVGMPYAGAGLAEDKSAIRDTPRMSVRDKGNDAPTYRRDHSLLWLPPRGGAAKLRCDDGCFRPSGACGTSPWSSSYRHAAQLGSGRVIEALEHKYHRPARLGGDQSFRRIPIGQGLGGLGTVLI